MPATDAFLLAIQDAASRDMAPLVKVELTSPSALTLYLSGREIVTPGSPPQVWQAALSDVEPVHSPGSLREASWSPCTSGFTVLDVPLVHQVGTTSTARDVFTTHRWIGAAVTIWEWDKSLTDFADAFPAAYAFRVQDYELEGMRVVVRIIQDWRWNREVQLSTVTRKKYPRAPEKSMGVALPKVRGRVLGTRMRDPWTAEYGDYQFIRELITGGRVGVPGVIVDVGGGGVAPGGSTKVVFASHPCKQFIDDTNGTYAMIEVDGKLCLMDADDTVEFNDSTDGAGIEIADKPVAPSDDPFGICYYPLLPVNIELVSNNAEGPRAVLDALNETSYAHLDYGAGYRHLRARMPTVSPPGELIRTYCEVGYRHTGSIANVHFRLQRTADTANTVHPGLTGSANPIAEGFSVSGAFGSGGGLPANPWAYGECVLEVYVDNTATVDVFFVGMIILFLPSREVTQVGQTYSERIERQERPRTRQRGDRPDHPERRRIDIPETREIKSAFAACLDGYADSGGTYTGTGTDLIQRAPDIAHHFLVLDGGLSTSDVETGASTFGSFVDARANLKTWRQSDMVHALVTANKEEINARALERLCDDAGIWVYRSEHDGKFKCIVWQSGMTVDYPRTITIRDIHESGIRLRPTPGTRRVTGVRVDYARNHFRGQSTQVCEVGPGRSVAGLKYRNLRDQQLTVIDSGEHQNNKLDFRIASTDYTATLTAGDYEPMDLAFEVSNEMAGEAGSAMTAGYGPFVRAGYNDKIPVYNGILDVAVTIPDAEYATMEDLASAVDTALSSDGWSCSYSRTTRKFTLTRDSGTKTIRWASAGVTLATAMGLLGYKLADLAGTQAADYEREEERFYVGSLTAAIDIEWETGAEGTNGNNVNCAGLLGFDATRDNDSTGATDVTFLGVCPKNNREQYVADMEHVGERAILRIDGGTIQDDDTAREVRDRAADLLLVDRPEVSFPLMFHPEIQRGQVFECDSSLDEVWPYAVEGSDGSWAGKKFVVVDKVKHLAGSGLTEVVAIEISAAA